MDNTIAVTSPVRTDAAPAAAGRSDELFVFIKDRDGQIQFNQAAMVGGSEEFVGWQTLPGLTTDAPLGVGMQADTLFVFAKDANGQIQFNQAAPGGAFVGWQTLPGVTTDAAPAAAGRSDNLFVFIKDANGQIQFNQAAPGGAFVGWQTLPGVTTDAPLGVGMQADTLFVFAKDANGQIQFNQAAPGGAFVGWQTLPGATTDAAPAAAGRSDNLFIFVKAPDGSILFNQAAPGGAFVGWQTLAGLITDTAPGAGMQASTLFVFARDNLGRVLFNQAAAGGAFLGWQEFPGEVPETIDSVCQGLQDTAPLHKVPPTQGLNLGTYDVGNNTFTWTEGPPFYTEVCISDGGPDDPTGQPIRVIEHHARVNGLITRVEINLVNSSLDVSLTVNNQTTVAPSGSQAAIINGSFNNQIGFSIGSGANGIGGSLYLDQQIILQAGCIEIPVLPVAIVYQPPSGIGTLETDETTGVGLSDLTSDVFPAATAAALSDVANGLHAFGDFLTSAGDVIDVSQLNAIGNWINSLANTLATDNSGPQGWDVQVHTENRLEVTAALGQSWSSAPQYGVGDGDLILYLRNVRFLVYKDNNHTFITPLGFDGPDPLDVIAARLKPGASDPPDLSDAERALLLSIDPVASGNAGQVMPGSRFTFVQHFSEANPGVTRTLEWGYTIDQSSMEETYGLPLDDGTNMTAGFTTRYERQGKTVQASVQAVGPFSFDVYYDNMFGTFAYQAA